jgi:hypothetical protein
MDWLILGGIAAIAVIAFASRKFSGRRGKSARPSYQKRDFLLSPEERLFFAALKQAVAETHEVFAHIPAQDILAPRAAAGREPAQQELEAIAEQAFDFVLCNHTDLSIACAVQLQEHTAAGKKPGSAADPLKPICQAAGLPLVRFEAAPLYDVNEIRNAIAAAVRKDPLFVVESDGRKEPRFSGLENLEL